MGEYGEGKRRKDYYTYIVDDAYHIRYYNSVVERDFPNVKDAAGQTPDHSAGGVPQPGKGF